jgi:hypothetical protein
VVESPNSAVTINNSGGFQGGNGGAGGGTDVNSGTAPFNVGGDGGDGGIGVFFENGVANAIDNSGTIKGGNGGAGGLVTNGGTSGNAGAGGEGIVGSNLNITNSGTIQGGMSGDGATQADAIDFIGCVNSLTLEAGSSIIGNVVAFSALDTLKLGGDTSPTTPFDVSTGQFQGFGSFEKTGL